MIGSFLNFAQGMTDDDYRNHKWSALLIHLDQESLGSKTFNYLDDRSLARTAQVHQNWQQLVDHVHDRTICADCGIKVILLPFDRQKEESYMKRKTYNSGGLIDENI